MYPRGIYVTLVGLATGALQFAAAFGTSWQYSAAFAAAFVLGAVVFYHGERRAVAGPIAANLGIGLVVGSLANLLLTAGLYSWILAVPWDLALWWSGLVVWDVSLGIGFTLVTSFFLAGMADALN